MTLHEDFERLDAAWSDLKRALLASREFHTYLAVTYLVVVAVAFMVWAL